MKKRILMFVLAAFMLLAFVPTSASATAQENNETIISIDFEDGSTHNIQAY